MNKVNMGDKYTHRITLRLNDAQYDYLIKVSNILGVSPSDYMRMSVNSGMVAMSQSIDVLNNGNAIDLNRIGVGTHEDVKTNSNNIV